MNKTMKLFVAVLACLLGGVRAFAADIPMTVGTYLTTSESTTSGTINNNDGGNLGGIQNGATATFTLNNATAQEMVLYFLTGNNNSSSPKVTVCLSDGSEYSFSETVDVENTGGWNPTTKHVFDLGTVPTGALTLTFSFANTGSYVCNLGSIGVYNKTAYNNTLDVIPGNITLTKGAYEGPKTENSGANVGYVKDGGKAAYAIYNSMEGGYNMTLDIYRYNVGGTMNVKIADLSTGTVEYNQNYTIASDAPGSYTSNTISIPSLTTGYKTMTFTFSGGNSYICNYKDIAFAYTGTAAEFTDYTITGQTVMEGTETDYLCNLPVTYDATTTFGVGATNGTVAVTAVNSSNEAVSVTDNNNGTYTVNTPNLNDYVVITATLTPETGATAAKLTSTLKIFRIGEISLTAVTVDGVSVDVLDDINNSATSYTATYGACYTTAPTITATQIDGAAATVGAPVISGSTYTYTIAAAISGTEIARDYTLVLNNVHVYAPTGSEESVNIKNNEGTRENNTWTNGIYALSTTSLDGYNQYFKMNGDSYTLSLPADVVVKQLIMKDCSNNYAGNNARLTAVTSTGATAYIPVDNKYYHETEGAKHDIIVNIDGHSPGTDIVLTQQKIGQPMAWIQLVVVKQDPGTAPQKTAESVTVVNNHAVVAVTFDREIPNDVTATINSANVTAEGGSAVLYFPVWNLNYGTDYTMTIPAGNVSDEYGNTNTAAIEVAVNIPAKTAVAAAPYDYVVSNTTELDAALAALKVSNRTAAATRKTVFLKNGNYDYGVLDGAYQYNVSLKIDNWNHVYNVSLIGESKEGVVITGTTTGITSATLNLGDGTGNYLQDMTIRNNFDFHSGSFNGVAVAIVGGNKTILKNVSLESDQDTYVTGQQTYLENCDIYGTVDFICGGGNIFFNQCNLILADRAGNVITAPNTTVDTKWGYVFQDCTIKADEGATQVVDKGWDLGRPWQNEPRAYFLNTTMEVLPTDNGWKSMGNLPTHFYEFNSMDASGNALDLSVRGNSPTSTNQYTPVLTAVEAARFTVENVLGGTDSWLPTDYCATLAAPANLALDGTTLSWNAVDDARCYVVFKDGEYVTNITATSYTVDDGEAAYTVCAANEYGGMGERATIAGTTIVIDEMTDYTNVDKIANVTLNRTIGADKWNTLVLPFDMTAEEVTATFGDNAKLAVLTGGDSENLNFSTSTTIKANQPCMIYVDQAFTTATLPAVSLKSEAPTQVAGDWSFIGGYLAENSIPQDAFFVKDNQWYQASDNSNKFRGTRAYLQYTGIGTPAKNINFIMDDEIVTGIVNVNVNGNVKVNDNAVYDLTGRKVADGTPSGSQATQSRLPKGIYIVNGKKIVVR